MPPWLLALLTKNNSRGMVDSLTELVGHPSYAIHADSSFKTKRGIAQLLGELTANAHNQPVVNLTPLTIENYALLDHKSGFDHPGYTPLPSKMGDAVIEHEFGHLAAYTGFASEFHDIDPNAESSEDFADRFQNAFQFLRTQRTDTKSLDESTQKIVDILLTHPLYANHPINQIRSREAQLKLFAGKPPS